MHVSWYEAQAYAGLGGPAAADRGGMGEGGAVRPGHRAVAPVPVGRRGPHAGPGQPGPALPPARPRRAATRRRGPAGARQLIGDVWEWTASDFLPYPGFTAWPYREYSEVFFGSEYKMLRGGSFASPRSPAAARSATGTTRSGGRSSPGFRTARDAGTRPRRRARGAALRCAATWPTSARPRRCGRCCSIRRTGWARQAWAPRQPAARDHERGRVRGRLVRRRGPDPCPVPAGRADLGRPVASPTWPRVTRTRALLAAVRSATEGTEHGAGRGRSVLGRPLAVQSQRQAERMARGGCRPRRHAACRRICSRWRRGVTPRWPGPWSLTGCGQGAGPRTRWPR